MKLDKTLRGRQWGLKLTDFAHDADDFAESFDVDLTLFRHNAAVRFEVERESLPGDVFGRSRCLDNDMHYFVAIGGSAHESVRRCQRAAKADQGGFCFFLPCP